MKKRKYREIFQTGAYRPTERQERQALAARKRLREQSQWEATTERVRAEQKRAVRYARYYKQKQEGWVYAKEVIIPILQPRPFMTPAILAMIEKFPLTVVGEMQKI